MDIKMNNEGFARSTPETQGVPSKAIEDCLNGIIATGLNVHSFWVFRNGYLIAGGCAKPFNNKMPRRLYSTMKSVIALAVHFLVQEGKIKYEDRISDYFPEFLPEKMPEHSDSLTVRDVLMMAVGHERDSLREYHQNKHGIGMVPLTYRDGEQPDLSDVSGKTMPELFFSMPFVHEPGEVFWYNNSIPEIVGMLVEKVSGEEYLTYLKPRLFDPLGINDMRVNRNFEANGFAWNDGATLTLCIEDLCKFALFYLQKGSWEGKQLLDADLIDEATANHIATAAFVKNAHGMSEKDEYGYGYQIWRNKFGGYRMVGGSGQEAIIMPEENMAIVYTSFDRHVGDPETDVDAIICNTIFKSIKKTPYRENPEAFASLEKCFADWSKLPGDYQPHSENESGLNGRLFTALDNELGITSVMPEFGLQKLRFEKDGDSIEIRYGLNGDFEENAKGLGHTPDGYSEIYGVNQDECFAAGGWINDVFSILLEYKGGMAPHFINLKFEGNQVTITE